MERYKAYTAWFSLMCYNIWEVIAQNVNTVAALAGIGMTIYLFWSKRNENRRAEVESELRIQLLQAQLSREKQG